MVVLRLSKSIFDSLVDGGIRSPATATPSGFHLNPSDSGREICKEAISPSENGIFLRGKRPVRDVHAAAHDFTGWSA